MVSVKIGGRRLKVALFRRNVNKTLLHIPHSHLSFFHIRDSRCLYIIIYIYIYISTLNLDSDCPIPPVTRISRKNQCEFYSWSRDHLYWWTSKIPMGGLVKLCNWVNCALIVSNCLLSFFLLRTEFYRCAVVISYQITSHHIRIISLYYHITSPHIQYHIS
jgi:hypothetical protein